MNEKEEIKAMVAYERYKRRDRMPPGKKRFLNRVFPELREAITTLYAKYGKEVRGWNLNWEKYAEDREILRCFREGEPIQKGERATLRSLMRKRGETPPSNVELADYPQYVWAHPREELEKILDRARHRPFGRRKVFWHLVKEWVPGQRTQRYRIKGYIGEIITLLEESLKKKGRKIPIIWTPRISTGWFKVKRHMVEESKSEEEKERDARRNLEVVRMLGSIR